MFHQSYFFMAKTRRERCPNCGFLEVIKWGRRGNHQRYKCKNCGSLFTFRRKDISKANRIALFGLNGGYLENKLFHKYQSLVDTANDNFIDGLMSILKSIQRGRFKGKKR